MEKFLAGAIAGFVSDGIMHPIDTLRARQQVQVSSTRGSLSNMYKGFGAVAVGTIPGHALYFAGYEYCKSFLSSFHSTRKDGRTAGVSQMISMSSGLFADLCGSMVWTPMEVVKQRVQVDPKTTSTKELVRILQQEGPLGLYRGFGLALLTYGPYVGIYFSIYEDLKYYINKDVYHIAEDAKLPFIAAFCAAGVSATISAIVTCPLDVIKTNYQVQTRSDTSITYIKTAKQIYKQSGATGFFRGLKPRCVWLAGGTALTLSFYENIKYAF